MVKFKQPIEENNLSVDKEISKEKVNVYLFWGDGCFACENLKLFFKELDNKYFNLIEYEVWNNEENKELLEKVKLELEDSPYVPYVVIGKDVVIGASNEDKIEIEELILKEYNNNDRFDIFKKT